MSRPARGGPAHPVFIVPGTMSQREIRDAQEQLRRLAPGASVWDFYAAAALTGWLAGSNAVHSFRDLVTRDGAEEIAKSVARLADAMMIERQSSRENRPLPQPMPEPSHGEER